VPATSCGRIRTAQPQPGLLRTTYRHTALYLPLGERAPRLAPSSQARAAHHGRGGGGAPGVELDVPRPSWRPCLPLLLLCSAAALPLVLTVRLCLLWWTVRGVGSRARSSATPRTPVPDGHHGVPDKRARGRCVASAVAAAAHTNLYLSHLPILLSCLRWTGRVCCVCTRVASLVLDAFLGCARLLHSSCTVLAWRCASFSWVVW
jgi:hypothetical protein